jgi:hypothetical protein
MAGPRGAAARQMSKLEAGRGRPLGLDPSVRRRVYDRASLARFGLLLPALRSRYPWGTRLLEGSGTEPNADPAHLPRCAPPSAGGHSPNPCDQRLD